MLYRLAIAVSALVMVSACEEDFELKTDVPLVLILDSQLEAGQPALISLSTFNTLGDTADASALSRSFVTLSTANGRSSILKSTNSTSQVAQYAGDLNEIIIAGQTYKLTVEAPGYAELRSTTLVPKAPSYNLPTVTISLANNPDATSDFLRLPLTLSDVPSQDNFYHIILRPHDSGQLLPEDLRGYGTPFRLDTELSNSVNAGAAGVLFSDADFTDGRLVANLLVSKSVFDDYESPSLDVEIRVVSRGYFDYFRELEGVGAGKLPQIRGAANISNGQGYFGSFSARRSSVQLSF